MSTPQLNLCSIAEPVTARKFRHALRAFLEGLGIRGDVRDDITLAVGEALANAVEHAYRSRELGDVSVAAHQADERTLVVDVVDRGTFDERGPRPGRGFGLQIARSIARSVTVDRHAGTWVQMTFDTG